MSSIHQDFVKFLQSLLGPEEALSFLSTVGSHALPSFRVNTLRSDDQKAIKLLEEEGFGVRSIDEIPHGYLVQKEPFPIGRSFSHYLGNIYIQDPSSMVPPLVLDPQPGELVLDVAAAPGSKTTQMAAMMGNRGLIVANDPSVRRSTSLSYNLMKCGVINTVVTILDGNRLGRLYFEFFDRVLLDPPCSGLGTLKNCPEVLKWWRMKRSEKLSRLQWNLMVSAIKALRPGGILVYSTCTIVPLENEALISRAIREYPVELEEIGWDGFDVRPGLREFMGEEFAPGMERAMRIYPHRCPGEGFFVARLRKVSGMKPPLERPRLESPPLVDRWHPTVRGFLDGLRDHFGIPDEFLEQFLYERAKELRVYPREAEGVGFLKYTHRGLPFAKPDGNPPTLTTWGAQFLAPWAKKNLLDLQDPRDLLRFLKHQDLPLREARKGQQLVLYRGHPVGYGIATRGILKSRAKVRREVQWPFCLEGL